MRTWKFFLILPAITLTLSSYGQQQIDTVNIFATRLPQQSFETGRHITVVTSADIEAMPVQSVDEVLRYLPGIEVKSRGAFGIQSDFTIRGSTFSQVLVLIDGVRINDPLTGHFNGYLPIAKEEIDRIEILKGPASAIYGADAMGGVVNIISKTYNNARQPKGMAVDASLSHGEHNYFGVNSGGFYKGGKINAGFGASAYQSDGQHLPSGLRSWFNNKTASGSVAVKVNEDWNIMYRIGYDDREFNAQFFYTLSPFDLSKEKTNAFWNHLKIFRLGKNSKTEIDVSYKFSQDYFLFNPAFPPANEHTTSLDNIRVHHYRLLNQKWTLSGGLQTTRRTIVSTDRGDHQDMHAGIYGIAAFRPVENLFLNGSLRLDWDENYGLELSPQFSAAYHLDHWTFRAAGGRSIRAADYTERYVSTNLPGPLPAGRNIGNPYLQAETGWTWEAGVDFQPKQRTKISATAFYREADNVIDYILTPGHVIPGNQNLDPSSEYLFADNIVGVNTRGAELELWHRQPIKDHWKLDLSTGYTFLDISTGEPLVAAKYISNQAKHLTNWNLVLHSKFGSLNLNGIYKVRDEEMAPALDQHLAPEYMVWNGKLSLNLYRNTFFAFAQVNNIFNKEYGDFLGAKMPDRWTIVGMRFNTGL